MTRSPDTELLTEPVMSSPTPSATGTTAAVQRLLRSEALRNGALVTSILVALQTLVFWDYFTGAVSPAPDDFIGSYNNEPFAWWRDLQFLDVPDWVPYAWGGYPAVVSIQNGSWYLPIGVTALLTDYSLHAAASLQALHVGFGALGMYTLGRRAGLPLNPAVFGLVAYFFAAGFYSNGLHPDIVRGFAWAPWLFLCCSPWLPWRRWWAIPVAALVLWQAVVGTYPGVVVALAFCLVASVVAFQVQGRHPFRTYLGPLLWAGVAAALLATPKYVAALLMRGLGSPTEQDDSVFSWPLLGTLFYSYDVPWLPNDLSMRPFFVVAPCLVLVVLAARKHNRCWPAIALGGTALALGMPFMPWYEALGDLPGLSLSRFRMADFRVPLILSVVLASMIVLARETERSSMREPGRTRRREWAATAALGLVPASAALLGVALDYPRNTVVPVWTIIAGSAVVAGLIVAPRTSRTASERRPGGTAAATSLTVLAAVSGVSWVYSVTPPWRFPLDAIERETWGATSEELIHEVEADPPASQRPARTPLDDAVAPPTDVFWNTSFYTGQDAVGGYVNLKGSDAFDTALAAVLAEDTYLSARSLLAAPGIALELPEDGSYPDPSAVELCAITGECGGGLVVAPVSYEPGLLSYEITADESTRVVFNEAHYPGWIVTACARDGECVALSTEDGPAGLIASEIPAGSWDVSLEYSTPGKARDVAAFLVGSLLVLVAAAAPVVRRPRAASGRAPDRGDPRPVETSSAD